MKTLESINRCKKITDDLLKINQESYVRDENLKPIGVNWNLEKQHAFFIRLMDMQQELEWISQKLENL